MAISKLRRNLLHQVVLGLADPCSRGRLWNGQALMIVTEIKVALQGREQLEPFVNLFTKALLLQFHLRQL